MNIPVSISVCNSMLQEHMSSTFALSIDDWIHFAALYNRQELVQLVQRACNPVAWPTLALRSMRRKPGSPQCEKRCLESWRSIEQLLLWTLPITPRSSTT